MHKQIPKPIVQKKTQIKYYPKYYDPQDHFKIFILKDQGGVNKIAPVPKEQRVVGNLMIAHLDPEDPRNGSETGSKEQAGLMRWLGSQEEKSALIKGHLLNHDLGGLGVSENLFPLTSAANGTHKNAVEMPTKGLLNKAKQNNAAFHKMTLKERQKNQGLPSDKQLHPNQAIVYTVQVRNNYSFATGVPDEFDCTVKTGYDEQQDKCDTFKQITEQHRIIKSDLLEKTQEYTPKSVSILDEDNMDGKIPGLKNVSDWGKYKKEWIDSKILTPGHGTGKLVGGDTARFSLSPYRLEREKKIASKTVKRNMGKVAMQVQSFANFTDKLKQKYLEGNFLDVLITLMEAYDADQLTVIQTVNVAKEYLCRSIPVVETDDVNKMLLNFFIRPVSIATEVLKWLLHRHWATLIHRNGLLVSILGRRWTELGEGVIFSCVGDAANKVNAELSNDINNGEKRFNEYKARILDILVHAKSTCENYSTEMNNGKFKKKNIFTYDTKFNTDVILKLDEKGVEALYHMESNKINWMQLAGKFEQAQNYLTAYYIYRVLYVYEKKPDGKIFFTLFDQIQQAQIPPISLFEFCYGLNKGFIIGIFRTFCNNIQNQDVLIENFTAQQILKYNDVTLDALLKSLPFAFKKLAYKCITGLSYMIDMQGFVDYINKGFWDIGDMEDILPQYMEKRALYEEVSLRKTAPSGITEIEEAGIKKEYHTINKFIQDAVDENPPLPTENLTIYSNRVCSIALKVAKEVLGNNYVENVVIQDISNIFTQYMKVKDMENKFWVAKAVKEPTSFLLNTNVKDVVNNPAISRELKDNILKTMTEQLFFSFELFENNFEKIYGLYKALKKYQISIPIKSAFLSIFNSNWSQYIKLKRCLDFSCFICEISYEGFFAQHEEIVEKIKKLIESEKNVDDFELEIHTLCECKILSKELYDKYFSLDID